MRKTSKWAPVTPISPNFGVAKLNPKKSGQWLLIDLETDATLMGPWGGVFPTRESAIREGERREREI